MTGSRSVRLGGLAVACVVAAAFLGACSSDGANEKAEVAAQDRVIEQGNKVQAQNLEKMKEALRIKWTQRAKVRKRARAAKRRAQRRVVVRTQVIASSGSGGDICAPIRQRFPGAAGRADRKARVLRRRQILDYLNLSCPSLNVPPV